MNYGWREQAQDMNAMRHARTLEGVEAVRRALIGLNRFDDEAQAVYEKARARFPESHVSATELLEVES